MEIKKILASLVVLAFLAVLIAVASTVAGCGYPYSYTGAHSRTINGQYNRDRTSTTVSNHDLTEFDGREAYWQCINIRNAQVYNSIRQAAFARQMGLPVPYAMIVPQDIDNYCRVQTSGGAAMGSMSNNGVTVMPVGFMGGSFDASRVPMGMAMAPSVQVVPVQTGASLPTAEVAPAPSTDALNQRVGVIYREVRRQGQAIARIQSHQ
jgi:hypothetical protein